MRADPYELLGLRPSASIADVRRAFRRLSRQLHPALNPTDPLAVERFRAVSDAFELLTDPDRRARHDRGETPEAGRAEAPAVAFAGFDFSGEGRAGAGFREIFDGLFGEPGSGTGQAPGEDIEQVARLSFAEAFLGARRRVQLVRYDACGGCQGTGVARRPEHRCDRCGGSGELSARRGHMVFTRSCPDCHGLGRQPLACPRCDGEGRQLQSEWLEVAIPAGVASGSRVRVPGCGNAGRRGGKPGDFVLAVEVAPHPLWKRDGDDLECELPLTVGEAALGAHVEIPTPDGPLTIEIPAGTQAGQRFRLRKRGMPRLGEGRGDLWVEARVVVPAVTDARGRELLEELARRQPQDPRAALWRDAHVKEA
jgi:molecular chaperone DnaJ